MTAEDLIRLEAELHIGVLKAKGVIGSAGDLSPDLAMRLVDAHDAVLKARQHELEAAWRIYGRSKYARS